MGSESPGQRAVALVKQACHQPQDWLVVEACRDVAVKLPIGGHKGRLISSPIHLKENLFECGNILRLHLNGGFFGDCSFKDASSSQNFQWSLFTRTVRRGTVGRRDDDSRAGSDVNVSFHLQGNQRFSQGWPGNSKALGEFSFRWKTTPGHKLPRR